MAKAKRVPRTLVPDVKGHPYQYLFAVTDGLTLELETIDHTEKGFRFNYRYTDRRNPSGFDSTKFGKVLPLYENDLQDNLVKKIMIVKPMLNGKK